MKKKKDYESLPIVEFVTTVDAYCDEMTKDIAKADTTMQMIQDPRIMKLSPYGGIGILDKLMALYMIEKWKKSGRAVYRFSKEFLADIKYTELPDLKLSDVKFPFDTFCFDFSENELFSSDGQRIYSVLVHYENCLNDFPYEEEKIDSLAEAAGIDINSPTVDLIKSSMTAERFEKISFKFILKPYGRAISYDITPESLHLPMSQMPELDDSVTQGNTDLIFMLLYLMLYISSQEPDIDLSETTKNYYKPSEKVKNTSVKIQDVGYHYMYEKKKKAEERARRAESQAIIGKTGTPKRPHMRKGHFSVYHVGTGRRDVVTRWLAPVMIHADEAALNESITIRLVDET